MTSRPRISSVESPTADVELILNVQRLTSHEQESGEREGLTSFSDVDVAGGGAVDIPQIPERFAGAQHFTHDNNSFAATNDVARMTSRAIDAPEIGTLAWRSGVANQLRESPTRPTHSLPERSDDDVTGNKVILSVSNGMFSVYHLI